MLIESISKTKNILGEGAWWNDEKQLLHWTDILAGKLYTFDPKTKEETFQKFDGTLGCFAPCNNGNFLIGLNLNFYIYNPQKKTTVKFAELTEEPKENRINDGTTDPLGRFWVGTMTKEGCPKKNNGSLYCIDNKGNVLKFKSGFYTPNGLAFNKMGDIMYFADTGKDVQTIWQFKYNLKSGIPSNQKIFTKTDDIKGRPDGGAVDINDYYWSASLEGSCLIRYNPNGKIDRTIDLPIKKPTKPVFGGKSLNIIYITSINNDLSNIDKNRKDLNGSVLAINQKNYKGFRLSNFNLGKN